MTTTSWTQYEINQPLSRVICFTHTTTGDAAENAVTLAGRMEEGIVFSFVVETNNAYVNFDATAVASATSNRDGVFTPANSGYSQETLRIRITNRISVINATAGQNVRIRGVIWGR